MTRPPPAPAAYYGPCCYAYPEYPAYYPGYYGPAYIGIHGYYGGPYHGGGWRR